MHGIARYAIRLANSMIAAATRHEFLLIAGHSKCLELISHTANARVRLVDIPLYRPSEQWRIAKLLAEEKPDVHFSPTFSAPTISHCPFVFTIHDLIHLRFPKSFSLLHRLYYHVIIRRAVARSSFVLTVSMCSRDDLISLLSVPQDKIRVVPEAPDPIFIPGDDTVARQLVAHIVPVEPFILWVGNEKPHKNFEGALEIMRALGRIGLSTPLVAVGVGDKYVRRFGIDGVDLITVTYVTDKELCALYRSARVLLCTSLYEGFGLVPLEAFACGTPAVIFDNSSLHELFSATGALVKPKDTKGIARRIKSLLLDDNECRRSAEVGAAYAAKFRWPDIARQVLQIIEEATSAEKMQ